MSAAPELFELPNRCPHCGAKPRYRPTAAQVAKWQDEPPHVLASTYLCAWNLGPGRKCNTLVRIYARDYQAATPYGG